MSTPRAADHVDVEAAPAQAAVHHGSSGATSQTDFRPRPPSLRSRGRATTVTTLNPADMRERQNWHPGEEPGIDPSRDDGGRHSAPNLHAQCDITVVDFSEDDMALHRLNNAGLPAFLQRHGQRGSWARCRWVNVNGLSWDVIQELGTWKKLHRLALEDLMFTRNRTKADWYSDHVYIVLPLLKLAHLHPAEDLDESDSDSDDDSRNSTRSHKRRFLSKMWRRWTGAGQKSQRDAFDDSYTSSGHVVGHTSEVENPSIQKLRTLQRYSNSPNHERAVFLERHSTLRSKHLCVCAEQVSIFLCSDNTIISFFETSAEDIEHPLLLRLKTTDTILRHSCDASMVVHAIIDAIVDLALPVSEAYQDALGDLELDVLTSPEIKHATRLHVLTTEINQCKSLVNPISSLIGSLKDHKDVHPYGMTAQTVAFSPSTYAYFGDVDDHILLISHAMDQMAATTSSLIDLIFNTIAAYQNDSLKQLTIITIVFLPMSFLTGYFGMNFHTFGSLDHGETFFWSIAIPVAVVTTLFLMREILYRYVVKTVQRRFIARARRGRLRKEARRAMSRKSEKAG